MIGKIKKFVNDVAKEMKKVSWPTKDQLRESTVIVIVSTLIFTAFVFFVDFLMTQFNNFVFLVNV